MAGSPRIYAAALLATIGVLSSGAVHAQSLPGSADGARILNAPKPEEREYKVQPKISASSQPAQKAPEGSDQIKFVLKSVQLSGVNAFAQNQLKEIYAGLLGQTVGLDQAWEIAARVTDEYRHAGYFLSRAYVPAQTIDDGVIKITVVEGFVEDVYVSGKATPSRLLARWIDKIKSFHPVRTQDLENALLELNSGYGTKYRAVLHPPESKEGREGAAALELVAEDAAGFGSVQIDNYGSKFLGVPEFRANYNASFLDNQNTSMTLIGSLPMKELKAVALQHKIFLMPKLALDLGGNYTKTVPGYTLKPQEIEGKTSALGAGLSYQWLLERDQELSTRLGFDAVWSETDILASTLSKDSLRVLRVSGSYSAYDTWNGHNRMGLTFSHGLDALGARPEGSLNLSRAEASPDFRKLEMYFARQQMLPYNLQASYRAQGQWADGPLLSSEEFGYGGQSFGRAYDNSEIVGDRGISNALELSYQGISPRYGVTVAPYIFYDIGKVWNLDKSGQVKVQSASSAGGGVRFVSDLGLSGGVGLAYPLTKEVNDPIYGANSSAPRILFEMGYNF